jgi:hypothetical protein
MMTDFEDKNPSAPLSIGTWIEMVLIGGFVLLGYFGMARSLWSWVATLFS